MVEVNKVSIKKVRQAVSKTEKVQYSDLQLISAPSSDDGMSACLALELRLTDQYNYENYNFADDRQYDFKVLQAEILIDGGISFGLVRTEQAAPDRITMKIYPPQNATFELIA